MSFNYALIIILPTSKCFVFNRYCKMCI